MLLCTPLLCAVLPLDPALAPEPAPTVIILMIADGAGYSTLEATRAWTDRPLAVDDWTGCALESSPLRRRREPTAEAGQPAPNPLAADPAVAYDPDAAWSDAPQEGEFRGYPLYFEGYAWLRSTAPDSAATMTAMVTGVRTYNGAINVDGAGAPLRTLAEIAHDHGRSCGSVTTVPFSHATPAAGAGAHALSRSAMHAIAREMFTQGVVQVIGGAGDPYRDNDGAMRDEPEYGAIDAAMWTALNAGTLTDAAGTPWTLVADRAAIANLAHGPTPARLAMIPPRSDTLQANRSSTGDPAVLAPDDDPRRDDVPSLSELSAAALNALDDDPDGFFLVIEGGAVDWAMHANHFGRMIEEYLDFDDAVGTVVDYVEAHGTLDWSNTLVVVTADHDHMLYGPQSDRVAFQPIEPRGAGVLPGFRWHGDGHGNQLVPLYARGAGADTIIARATRTDPRRGRYLHQADLGAALIELVERQPSARPSGRVPGSRP